MANNRTITADEVFLRISDEDIRFLDFKFVDLLGTLQHVTLPVGAVQKDIFHKGLGFDGSSVRGFQKINESDMKLFPEVGTLFKDPFFDDPTLSVFCDIVDPSGYKPYSRDPRGVARRAERLTNSLGIADEVFFGPELEFFVFDDVRYDHATQHSYYFVDSNTAFWNTGRTAGPNLAHRADRKLAYFAAAPVDAFQNLRSKMSTILGQVGLEPDLHHHEVASAGQNEIGFRFGTLIESADNSILFKYVIKNVANRHGKTATFMPKPLFEENGSGMHVHVSLWKDGTNLFYQSGGYAELSEMAVHFIGGILHHAPALCAFVAPTTNSYRRLVPGYEAPMNLVYSQRNRSACIRVPMFAASPSTKRIEFRTPDPSCNPYLAFASILLAGIDGVRNQIEPPEPIDEDIYELAGTERGKSISRTPASLDEAIDALDRDREFLIADDVFPEDLIQMWIDIKRKEEIDFLRLRPHPGEFSLYYNV
ncbi:MAG: type I glutamate--ammonia ligase [Acidobacteriota bacterium]